MLGARLGGRRRVPAAAASAIVAGLAAAVLVPAVLPRLAQAASKPAPKPAAPASELWATVDLCNTPHHPDTIGVRGSMPGDGQHADTMYMRFLVQSLDSSTHRWNYLGERADSGFVEVGSAGTARQAGHNFQFKPTTTQFTLRGLVEFQWHHAGRTVRSVYVATSAHHSSLAGAEPKGFSAATCALP